MLKQIVTTLVLFAVFAGCSPSDEYKPQIGDIIFHTSQSPQSIAIQRATKSKYSHMGVVYLKDGQAYVFEAVEPVKSTPLLSWIARGKDGHYVVKRLANTKDILTTKALHRMKEVGDRFKGRHYDLYFEWSDDRIYCSELVWKIYKRTLNLEVGKLQEMREFDLSDPLVQAKVRERFGGSLPLNETVISPAAIYASNLLVTVHEE